MDVYDITSVGPPLYQHYQVKQSDKRANKSLAAPTA